MNERYQNRSGSHSRQDEQNLSSAGRDDRASAGPGYWNDRGNGADWQGDRPERGAGYSSAQQSLWSREPGRIGQYQGDRPSVGQGGYGGHYSRDYMGAGESQQYGPNPAQPGNPLPYGSNFRPGRFGSSYGNYGSGPVYGSDQGSGGPGGYGGQGNYGGGYGIEAGGPYPQRDIHDLNRHAGRGPKGYQRSDDRLREVISERLTEAPHIDASEITVTVKNSAVTLDGMVDERWIRHEIENLVEACGGVKDIHNNLRVMSSRQQSGSAAQNLADDESGGDALLSGSPSSTRKN